jgi:haloalkane dehalogenase
MAYFETFVAPVTLEDMPERFHPMVKVLRSSAGEALVRDENMLIEKFLPSITQRALSADEMAVYRRPFLQAGDDRWLTLVWAREVPWSGEPADVHDRIAAYSAWLRTAQLPKLFIDVEPGVFISSGRIKNLARSFPNQHHVVLEGLHFVQEDRPDEVGRAIAGWLQRI